MCAQKQTTIMSKKKEFIPYGPEWEKEISKLPKESIIAMLKNKGEECAGLQLGVVIRRKTIMKRIEEILADKRLAQKTATIEVNSILTLIQLQMETELHTLQKVIGEPLTNIKQLRKEE